ncbi:MAG: hypothetical protein IKR68_03730 [Lachnospiraceae bacterium]|nr:hypothetical protein [Lachnospiraceae bacterium]
MRFRELKAKLACVLAVSMLFGTNTVQLMAAEPYEEAAFVETEAVMEDVADVEQAPEAVAAEEPEAAEPTAEEAVQEEVVTASAEEDAVGGEEINIEINQGFSLHEKKDMLKSDSLTYMSNFVAGKATAVMFSVAADTEEAAKEKVKNWKLYYKPVDKDGNEGNAEVTWDKLADEAEFKKYYDENSNTVSGNIMVVASLKTGPSKGKYTFYLDDADGKNIAKMGNIDFYDTQPLNILAVPVTAYYSKSANPEGGGCPADQAEKPVPCGEKWNTTIADVKKYLSDVYPVAEINVDEGHAIDAGTAEYDMCTDDGQKKLWEEACKLQSKNKETGKDKYDIILAFVMYRQDATGCGQGYTYGKPANIITLMDKDMLPTVAHEIAHCYEVGDEYDGGSYNYRVNNVPLEYKSNGRDKVTGEAVSDTTEYTMKNIGAYEKDQSKYYWLSGGQYQKGLGGKTVMDGKSDIADNGSGGVVYPSLHPYILSEKEFVHFAVDDNKKAYPTLSYMGSGYSGDKFYYFTTSVIWDHLLDQFLVKSKKAENGEENNNGATVSADDMDLYYDEGYREGSSRMVEVAGEVLYDSVSDNATVSGCVVDPMFSYQGDLSYIEYFEDEEKDIPKDDRFIFAAIGKDGKVMKSPVDGEEATVEFYGGNFNSAMPAPAKGSGLKDKRYQDFCEFAFDAEYPEGTDMFVVVKENDFDSKKVYKKTDKSVLWYRDTPDKIIDGELKDVQQSKDKFSFSWDAAAYDENDNATTKNLYTMIYFAPQGDDGDVYFIEDGDYEKDFGAANNGVASFSFNPSEYTDNINDKAYAWIKVSDGVNGLDLYTDEFEGGATEEKAAAATEKLIASMTLDKKDPNYKTEQKVNVWGAVGDTVSTCVAIKKNKVKSITLDYDKNKGVSENKATLNAKTKLTGFKGYTVAISDVVPVANISEKASKKVDKAVDKAQKKANKTLKRKNVLTIPTIKNVDSYKLVFTEAEGKSGVTVTVVNVRFDKKELKGTKISKEAVVSANNVSENAVPASETACVAVKDNIITLGTMPYKNRFVGGYWMVGKTPITKIGVTTAAKSGKVQLNAVVNKNGTITFALAPENVKKGSVKLTYCLNGKKYKASIKVTK